MDCGRFSYGLRAILSRGSAMCDDRSTRLAAPRAIANSISLWPHPCGTAPASRPGRPAHRQLNIPVAPSLWHRFVTGGLPPMPCGTGLHPVVLPPPCGTGLQPVDSQDPCGPGFRPMVRPVALDCIRWSSPMPCGTSSPCGPIPVAPDCIQYCPGFWWSTNPNISYLRPGAVCGTQHLWHGDARLERSVRPRSRSPRIRSWVAGVSGWPRSPGPPATTSP